MFASFVYCNIQYSVIPGVIQYKETVGGMCICDRLCCGKRRIPLYCEQGGLMTTVLFIFILLAGVGLLFFFLMQPKKEDDVAAPELREGDLEHKQVEEIISGYLNALMKDPDDANLRYSLADVQVKNERVKEGLGNLKLLFEKGMEKMPRLFYQALLLAADAEGKLENRDGRRGYLKKALELQPDEPELNAALGRMEYEVGNFLDAAEAARRILKVSPGSAEANLLLGQVLYRKGSLDEAVPCFERVLEKEPANVPAIVGLGRVLARQDRVQEGSGWLSRALEFLEGDDAARIRFEMGTLYRRNGLHEKAEVSLREVLVPGVGVENRMLALRELCALYKDKEDIAMIIWALRDLIALEKNNASLKEELAHYLELNSDTRFQKYTMLGQSAFEEYCSRIAASVFPSGSVSRREGRTDGEVEILVTVRENEKPLVVLFRFVRCQSPVGTVALSDVYASMKRFKAEKAYMVAPGGFSDEAKEYAQMRMMALADRPKLLKMLAALPDDDQV